MKRTVKDLVNLRGKVVILRVDFNVPVDDTGKVLDYSRVNEALPTIKYLVSQGAKIVIISHLGRPQGYEIRKSLWPISLYLLKFFPNKVYFSNYVLGDEVKQRVKSLGEGCIQVLENVRFYEEEEKCDMKFAKEIASLGDIFVNDAFGVSHRKHASIYGVARILPNAIGLLMEKEITNLTQCLENPKRPFVAVIGGVKIKDKIKMLKKLIDIADCILLGGAMAYTFLVATGVAVASSLTSIESIATAQEILDYAKQKGKKVLLPVDHVAVRLSDKKQRKETVDFMVEDMVGYDIGPKTIKLYSEEIAKAGQILWNGPLGKYEDARFKEGTFKIAEAIAHSRAYSVVGGGDSVSAVRQCGLANKINFLSTGGGATLKFIEDGTLPGIEVIQEKIR